MAWPELSKTIKAVDVSWYQHDGTDQRRPFDVDLFCEKHPDVELALIRACWPSGKPDAHYPHYFDGFMRNDVKVAAYLWPNPIRPISEVADNWKRALGDRVPDLLELDLELTFYQSDTIITANAKESIERLRILWPDPAVIPYTRATWWDQHITDPDWFRDMRFHLAHYPYITYDQRAGKWRVAYSFGEVTSKLPIDNGFTPFRGAAIRQEQVVAWQFTDKGRLAPVRGAIDLDFYSRPWVESVYGDFADETQEPVGRARVQITYDPSTTEIILNAEG